MITVLFKQLVLICFSTRRNNTLFFLEQLRLLMNIRGSLVVLLKLSVQNINTDVHIQSRGLIVHLKFPAILNNSKNLKPSHNIAIIS